MMYTDNYRNNGIGSLILARLKTDYSVLNIHVYEKNEGVYTKHHFKIRSKKFEEDTQEYEYFME
jgi:putative acetyltransferase